MKEPKFIKEKRLRKYIALIEHLELICIEVEEVIRIQLNEEFLHKITLYTILERIHEAINAIKILTLYGFPRDVAILALNIFELKLDFTYICNNHGEHKRWLEHNEMKNKPWKVSKLIDINFNDPIENKSEKWKYAMLSMVKHGNPTGNTQSFTLSYNSKEGTLSFSNDENRKHLLALYLYIVGKDFISCLLKSCDILISSEDKVGDWKEKILHIDKQLSQFFDSTLEEDLLKLLYTEKSTTNFG